MNITFEQWMERVDHICVGTAGVSVHDLPDQSFRDYYNDGLSPDEVAMSALYNEGWMDTE